MPSPAPDAAPHRGAPWLNLLLPGGGLILQGQTFSGLLVGLAFTASANFALLAVLLFPDDFSYHEQCLGIGLTLGCYVGAQLRLVQCTRALLARAVATRRRALLWETKEHIDRGEHAAALAVISPLATELPDDLLVAYRLAQALTAAGTSHAARIAWKRVRALDHHGIYRQQLRAFEQQIEPAAPRPGTD